MGELIVGLIIVIIVLLIVKNNSQKSSRTDLYQEAKRNHEELKKSKSKKANKAKSKPSKPSKPKKKAKEDKYPLRPQKKARKTKHKKFTNKVKVSHEEWQAEQAKANKQAKQAKAEWQGELGEQKIVDTLEYLDIYGKTLSNVYVPKVSGGGTTEIDVIYINQYGIYVIESKNYNGSIYGDDKYDKWVVYYRKARDGSENKFHFYSPVKQNETHIKHLSEKLWTIDKKDFHSVVVFTKPFNMKVNSKSDVVMLKDLNPLINKYESGEDTVFSKKEVDKIYNLLKPYTDVSDKVKKAHLVQAKRAKRYNNKKYFSK